jgi:hypothetical protein
MVRPNDHHLRIVQPNRTYCGRYGGDHTYRPMYLPPGVGLLRPPPVFPPLTNETRAVPVMRVEDDYPIPFYYWAEGCSDTFIRVNRGNALVAHDRVDAIRQLLSYSQAHRVFIEHCRAEMGEAALHVFPRAMLISGAWVDISAARTMITSTGCCNSILYTTMRRKGIKTLVLNFESPGGDTSGATNVKKTEIIHLGQQFYDVEGAVARIPPHNASRVYQNKSLSGRWHARRTFQ